MATATRARKRTKTKASKPAASAHPAVDEVEQNGPPEQLDLIPDLDNVPKEIKNAANQYKSAAIDKGKANAKFNTKRDNLIALMKEHDVPAVKVTIEGVLKVFYLDATEKIKERKPKEPPKAEAK